MWSSNVESMEHTKCKICDVKTKENNKLQPILVSFPHGSLLYDEVLSLKCTVCHKISSKKQHVAVATKDSNVYVGSVEESYTSNVCNTFIAIRNRKTNNIRLIECDNILMSRFATKQPTLLVNGVENEKITPDQSYSTLSKSFGSKVKKRRTEQRERYRTTIKTLEDNLNNVVSTVDTSSFIEHPVTSDSILPPCNRSASSVDDVYQLYDLISKVELDSTEPEALELLSNFDCSNTTDYTPFFTKNVSLLQKSNDSLQGMKVLLYADCLLRFFKTAFKGSELGLFKKACPYSQMIAEKIRREFTLESNSKKRLRPNSMCEKAMCHVIVLGLLIFNFKLDLQTVTESSRTSIKRLIALSKALGATVDRGTVVTLKLPLAVPLSLPLNKSIAKKK